MGDRHCRTASLLATLLAGTLVACSPTVTVDHTPTRPLFSHLPTTTDGTPSPAPEAPPPGTDAEPAVDPEPAVAADPGQEPLSPTGGAELIPAPLMSAEGPQPIPLDTGAGGFTSGPPENFTWEITDLQAYGFTQLKLDITSEGQNARLQFPITTDTTDPASLSDISWSAYGLNGEEEAVGRCESDWYFTDGSGQRVTFPDTGSTFVEGPYSRCRAATKMIIPDTGPLTLHFFIRNPGFERLHLTFDILGVS